MQAHSVFKSSASGHSAAAISFTVESRVQNLPSEIPVGINGQSWRGKRVSCDTLRRARGALLNQSSSIVLCVACWLVLPREWCMWAMNRPISTMMGTSEKNCSKSYATVCCRSKTRAGIPRSYLCFMGAVITTCFLLMLHSRHTAVYRCSCYKGFDSLCQQVVSSSIETYDFAALFEPTREYDVACSTLHHNVRSYYQSRIYTTSDRSWKAMGARRMVPILELSSIWASRVTNGDINLWRERWWPASAEMWLRRHMHTTCMGAGSLT